MYSRQREREQRQERWMTMAFHGVSLGTHTLSVSGGCGCIVLLHFCSKPNWPSDEMRTSDVNTTIHFLLHSTLLYNLFPFDLKHPMQAIVYASTHGPSHLHPHLDSLALARTSIVPHMPLSQSQRTACGSRSDTCRKSMRIASALPLTKSSYIVPGCLSKTLE